MKRNVVILGASGKEILENVKDRIEDYLDTLDAGELIEFHNEYCNVTNNIEDHIYKMYEANDILTGTPLEIISSLNIEYFNPEEDYFRNTVYGYESTDFPESDWIDTSEIADYMARNEDAFGDSTIDDILEDLYDVTWSDEE